MAKRPIIIDCDPGQDDAIALLLAMSSPDELELLGVTTVAETCRLHSQNATRDRCAISPAATMSRCMPVVRNR